MKAPANPSRNVSTRPGRSSPRHGSFRLVPAAGLPELASHSYVAVLSASTHLGGDEPGRQAGSAQPMEVDPKEIGGRRRRIGPNSDASTSVAHSASVAGGKASPSESFLNWDSSDAVRASETRAVAPPPWLNRWLRPRIAAAAIRYPVA